MALQPAEIKALVKVKGWTFVDIAARWRVSVTWMSRLVNNPEGRALMYDDAFRGLPPRQDAQIVRQPRHIRKLSEEAKAQKRKKKAPRAWTPEEMFPVGRIFHALDSKILEEGTRVVALGVEHRDAGVFVAYEILDGDAQGESFEMPMEQAQLHFQDAGLDHPEA